jgi:hypothetical protein
MYHFQLLANHGTDLSFLAFPRDRCVSDFAQSFRLPEATPDKPAFIDCNSTGLHYFPASLFHARLAQW